MTNIRTHQIREASGAFYPDTQHTGAQDMSTHGRTAAEYLEAQRADLEAEAARLRARGIDARCIPLFTKCNGASVLCGYDIEVHACLSQLESQEYTS